jgi:hypothetical protein
MRLHAIGSRYPNETGSADHFPRDSPDIRKNNPGLLFKSGPYFVLFKAQKRSDHALNTTL